MKYTKYPELKNELKNLANEIRTWKRNRKQDKRIELKLALWEVEVELYRRRREFRHKHIAYCMLRGKKYEEIERNCNKEYPNFDIIDRIIKSYEPKVVRISA